MKLLRVQVPEFRALKNVDISFEPDFKPNIFPLASQNGGGKSTLLQLIFALTNCVATDRFKYCRNLLSSIDIHEEKRSWATLDFIDQNDKISLSYNLNIISNQTKSSLPDSLLKTRAEIDSWLVQTLIYAERIKSKFTEKYDNSLSLKKEMQAIIEDSPFLGDQRFTFEQDYSKYFNHYPDYSLKLPEEIESGNIETNQNIFDMLSSFWKLASNANDLILKFEEEFSQIDQCFLGQINEFRFNGINVFLGCKISGSPRVTDINSYEFFKNMRHELFLSMPETQICLLISQKSRKSLFSKEDRFWYEIEMQELKRSVPDFFTPSTIPTETILKEFEKSRDEDFKNAIKTGNQYGNNYVNLKQDIQNLLINKRIDIDPDTDSPLSRIKVLIKDGDELREIYPEDLSHGELKQLSLYIWLRHNNIKDAVVLMDEIEIALHPDWQYQIIKDLEEWGPTNQYILATHSYELCTALTPSHVKEIEPKLESSRNHESE
ncbi:MAG: AAA family ATPase [Spirulina sp. SIO3F2]|nr:AAA family ATPase [Spirulina sp. SIO3F2]